MSLNNNFVSKNTTYLLQKSMTASSQEYGSRKIWPKWQEKYCSTTDCTVADFFSTKLCNLKPKFGC